MAQVDTIEVIALPSNPAGTGYNEQALIEEARYFQRQRRQWAGIILAVIIILIIATSLVFGVGRGPAKAASAPAELVSVGGPSTCSVSGLSFRKPVSAGAAAGTSYIKIDFVNRGASCRLALMDAQPYNSVTHKTVGPVARVEGNVGSNLTANQFVHQRLAPGAVARISVAFQTAMNYPSKVCRIGVANSLYLFSPSKPGVRVLVIDVVHQHGEQVCTRLVSLFTVGPWLGK